MDLLSENLFSMNKLHEPHINAKTFHPFYLPYDKYSKASSKGLLLKIPSSFLSYVYIHV